jgi:hypothetical protein
MRMHYTLIVLGYEILEISGDGVELVYSVS